VTDGSEQVRPPVHLPKADLGAAFGPASTDRTAGLRGLDLNRRPREKASDPAAAPVRDLAEARAATPAQPEPPSDAQDRPAKKTRRRPTQPASAEADSGVQAVIVYLPASLRERLRARRSETGDTYTTLALDAVEHCHAELADLLADVRPAARSQGLFAHRGPRRVQHAEPQVQVNIRPSRGDLTVLDQLVEQHQAPSRSALVAVALNRYLP
jgi:hypothetical protein